MAEKGETKILAIFTICFMLISIGLSGCVEEDESSYYPKEEDLELQLSLNKHEFKINDTTVEVNITLKNISTKTLKLEYLFSIGIFIDVWVTTESNNTIHPLFYEIDPSRKTIILKSNEFLKENFFFFEYIWYNSNNDFHWIPGNYTINSNYQYYEMQKIESNPFNFKII
jgi:hypothetical protein